MLFLPTNKKQPYFLRNESCYGLQKNYLEMYHNWGKMSK